MVLSGYERPPLLKPVEAEYKVGIGIGCIDGFFFKSPKPKE